jgi:hypothetical protein
MLDVHMQPPLRDTTALLKYLCLFVSTMRRNTGGWAGFCATGK